MGRNRFGFGLGGAVVLGIGLVVAACADAEPTPEGGPDAATEGGDGGPPGKQDASDQDAREDTGARDAGTDAKDAAKDVDAAPVPGLVSDLAAVAETHVDVKLTWTAPPDHTGTGTVTLYEIRYATTPITTEAEFLAATAFDLPPAPEAPGVSQTVTVDMLTPETQYYLALRAQYANEEWGPLSNIATVTTKARAAFVISEIAPANTTANGGDFIEIVATKAGSAAGLRVANGGLFPSFGVFPTTLHAIKALDVAVGDRIVVHLSGLPGPTGFAQEDETKSKTSSTEGNASANAYDVYSSVNDLLGLGAISIIDNDAYTDAVAYSDRSNDYAEATMQHVFWGYLTFQMSNQWSFSMTDEQWSQYASVETSCPVLLETVNASGDATPVCGGPAGGLTDGKSIQRSGTTDTNSPADFTIAPQTRGQP